MVHSIILVVAYVVMRGAVNLEKWMQIPSTNLRAHMFHSGEKPLQGF